MSTTTAPRTLADLDALARQRFYVPHFGLLDGLEREIETLAHEQGVMTCALASYLLQLALAVYRAQQAEQVAS